MFAVIQLHEFASEGKGNASIKKAHTKALVECGVPDKYCNTMSVPVCITNACPVAVKMREEKNCWTHFVRDLLWFIAFT